MATNGEPFNHRNRKGCLTLALVGLVLSTGGVPLQEPQLSTSLIKGPDQISILLPVCSYLFLLNFYLNMLLLLLLVMSRTEAPEAPLSVFVIKHLSRAAQAISFATLLFSTPLWVHVAVTEESVGFAIGALLLCLASVTVLASVFKNFLITCFHAGRAFIPALFAICISTQILIFFDPFLSFSNENNNNPQNHIALNYLLLFVVFFIFVIGITLLILRMGAAAAGLQAAIQAEHLAIAFLSLAFATLCVGVYLIVFAAAADMSVVGVNAIEK